MADAVTVPLTEDDNPSRTFQLTSAGSILNLTGATVVAIIKASQSVEDNAGPGVYTLTVGSGLTIADAALGKVQLDIPSAVTASPSWWFYKIRVTRNSRTETAITGWICVQDA